MGPLEGAMIKWRTVHIVVICAAFLFIGAVILGYI